LGNKVIETSGNPLTYRHTQKGPWHLLLYAFGVVMIIAGVLIQGEPALNFTLLGTGFFMLLLSASFHHLTVEDEGNQLVIRFGPFPLFRKRIWYDDILEVKKGRTMFLDGWGIHWSPWGGRLWNIWGYDCVVIRLKRGRLRVGTDDPDGLVVFLTSRIAKNQATP
jgi:hypothetical protein